MSKKHCIQQLAEKITGSSCNCRTVKDGLKIIAQKACGDDTKEFKSICDALDCINEHFDNLGGGTGGGSVKLYAWKKDDWCYAYSLDENLDGGAVALCANEGDAWTEIYKGKLSADGSFVSDDGNISYSGYSQRCSEKDIELTVNSSGSSSDSGANTLEYQTFTVAKSDGSIRIASADINNFAFEIIEQPEKLYSVCGSRDTGYYLNDNRIQNAYVDSDYEYLELPINELNVGEYNLILEWGGSKLKTNVIVSITD